MSKAELIQQGALVGDFARIETGGSTCSVTNEQGTVHVRGVLGPATEAEAGLAFGLDVGFGRWKTRNQLSFAILSRSGPTKVSVRASWSSADPDENGNFAGADGVSVATVEAAQTWRAVVVDIPAELRREGRDVTEIHFVLSGAEAPFAFDVRDVRVLSAAR